MCFVIIVQSVAQKKASRTECFYMKIFGRSFNGHSSLDNLQAAAADGVPKLYSDPTLVRRPKVYASFVEDVLARQVAQLRPCNSPTAGVGVGGWRGGGGSFLREGRNYQERCA